MRSPPSLAPPVFNCYKAPVYKVFLLTYRVDELTTAYLIPNSLQQHSLKQHHKLLARRAAMLVVMILDSARV